MSETILLKGAPLARAVKEQVAAEAARLRESGTIPRLAVVLASDDPAAASYAQSKQKAAASLGIVIDLIDLGRTSQDALEAKLAELGRDATVHGILLELPLAAGL